MRCAPQNPPVSVLTKGFCNGVGVPGVPHNPPISDRIKGFCDSGLSDAKTPAARIPLSPCRQCQETNGLPCWIQRSLRKNIACRGKKGEQLLGLLGAVTKLRRLLANACDELQGKVLRTSSWPNLPSVEL